MLAKWSARTASTTRPCSPLRMPYNSRAVAYATGFQHVSRLLRTCSVSNGTQLTVDPLPSHASTLWDPSSGLVLSDAQRKTIYALSTPPGKAGVAVVRVSGPDAWHVWHSMVSMTSKGKIKEKPKMDGHKRNPEPWRMYRCDVVHPRTQELLDSGLAVYFKGLEDRTKLR